MSAKDFFDTLEARADLSKLDGIDHSYLFDVEGEGQWLVEIRDGAVRVHEGRADADVTISVGGDTFSRIASGQQSPVLAYTMRKLKVSGDTSAALKLLKIF